jgi:hypothetical protein
MVEIDGADNEEFDPLTPAVNLCEIEPPEPTVAVYVVPGATVNVPVKYPPAPPPPPPLVAPPAPPPATTR